VLSINATGGEGAVFSRFDVAEVDTIYAIGTGKQVKELIVRGE
jgi:hypothetical protein